MYSPTGPIKNENKQSWLADLAGLVPTVGPILSGIINRFQSKGDIANQNEYNSPANQLARLREAGLPMGAMTGAVSSTQSSLPQTSGAGVQEGTRNIGAFIQTQMQLKQLEILNSEIKLKEAEAKRAGAETTYLFELAGEDRQGTNLTRGLKQQFNIGQSGIVKQAADTAATKVATQVTEGELANQKTRQNLENQKTIADIAKTLRDKDLVDEKITSEEINQRIQSVLAEYQPEMSDAELGILLKNNDLIDRNVSGKELENAIQATRYRIGRATEQAEIDIVNKESIIKGIQSDAVAEQFESYTRYQDFVRKVQDELNKPFTWKSLTPEGVKSRIEAIIAQAYTATTGITGSSPGLTTILNGLK